MKNLGLLLSHLGAAVIALHFGFLSSLQQHAQEQADCAKHRAPDLLIVERVAQQPQQQSHQDSNAEAFFVPTIRDLFVGGALIPRNEFQAVFDLGFPLGDNSSATNSQVVLLYQSTESLPTNYSQQSSNNQSHVFRTIHSLEHALENCDLVRHISMPMGTRPGVTTRNTQTCTALVGQTEADYVYKWIQPQIDPNKKKRVDNSNKNARQPIIFEPASRYKFDKDFEYNAVQLVPASKKNVPVALEQLRDYLAALPKALERLAPIAKQVGMAGEPLVQNTIMVMVTNFGHAELFINFCCAARRVGMDLSKVLLFATDQDTYDLAQAMGVAVFYDEDVFASIPRNSSAKYGDSHYAKIMMSKVYCVHMISQLGYDIVFQDVDIIPYSGRYLEWFVELALKEPDFDMFFQNDHNYRAEYSPYVTNSGCYYGESVLRWTSERSDGVSPMDVVYLKKVMIMIHLTDFSLRFIPLYSQEQSSHAIFLDRLCQTRRRCHPGQEPSGRHVGPADGACQVVRSPTQDSVGRQ